MITIKGATRHADIIIENIEAARTLIEALIEERETMIAEYSARGAAMRSTGEVVRSLYTPQIKILKEIIRELWAGNIFRARELDLEFKTKWPEIF